MTHSRSGRGARVAAAAFVAGALALGCSSSADMNGAAGTGGLPAATGGTGGPSPGTGGVTGDPGTHPGPGSSWTVLVYMTADNDLEPFALIDLEEMMAVGSRLGFNLVVQIDRAAGNAPQGVGGLPDFTTAKRVRVQRGALEELADLGEVDMASPQTLGDFIAWGLTTFPSDQNALVMWDHGGGWRGFGLDESSGHLLSVPQILQGVAAGRQAANAKPFRLIGFDACLMATWEVGVTLAPHAEYLLASEEVEPGHGWDWRSIAIAADAPSTDPVALGRAMITGYRAQAAENNKIDSITLSLVDLTKLGAVTDALGGLGQAFGAQPLPLATAFGKGNERALKFGDAPDPTAATNMVDLDNLAALSAQAGQDQALTAAQQRLSAAIAGAVVASVAGAGKAQARGLSIYFPPEQAYYIPGYDEIAAAAPWRGFLAAYFQNGAAVVPPTFSNPNKVADATFAANGDWTLSGTLTPGTEAGVARAQLLYGIISPTLLVVLGDAPAVMAGTSVGAAWELSAFTLTQGATAGFGYANIDQVDPAHVALNVFFQYQESAADAPKTCLRQLVIAGAGETATLTSDTYYLEENGSFGQLTPVEGSTLMPLLIGLDPNTGDTSLVPGASSAFVATAGAGGQPVFDIALGFERLPAAQQVFGILHVESSGGKGDSVVASAVVP
jgi:hypothetical protein